MFSMAVQPFFENVIMLLKCSINAAYSPRTLSFFNLAFRKVFFAASTVPMHRRFHTE